MTKCIKLKGVHLFDCPHVPADMSNEDKAKHFDSFVIEEGGKVRIVAIHCAECINIIEDWLQDKRIKFTIEHSKRGEWFIA